MEKSALTEAGAVTLWKEQTRDEVMERYSTDGEATQKQKNPSKKVKKSPVEQYIALGVPTLFDEPSTENTLQKLKPLSLRNAARRK